MDFRKLWPKRATLLRPKSVVLAVMLLIAAVGASVFAATAAYRSYLQQQVPAEYALSIVAPTLSAAADSPSASASAGLFLPNNRADIELTITQSRVTNHELELELLLDEQQIYQQTLASAEAEQSVVVPIDISNVEEGTHVVTVRLVQLGVEAGEDRVLAQEHLELVNDLTSPELLSVEAKKGYLTQYTVPEATPAAQTGLKLVTNSSQDLGLQLHFSESVSQVRPDASAAALLTVAETDTYQATHAAAITAQTSIVEPFSFKDLVGNLIKGEVQVVFDTQAPTLKTSDSIRVDPSKNPTFMTTFTASEPVSNIRTTFNGQTRTGSGKFPNYAIRDIPSGPESGTLVITAQDLAGNTVQHQLRVEHYQQRSIPWDEFFSTRKSSNVRNCTQEDKDACGYVNVSLMTCEEFGVVRDCLKKRCTSGFYLGDCKY